MIVLCAILLPLVSYGQDKSGNNKEEDMTITINVSKINRTLGKVVGAGKNMVAGTRKEMKQFVDEIPQEEKDKAKEIVITEKKNLKNAGRYILDCMHAGWSAGWKGEGYVRPYEFKSE